MSLCVRHEGELQTAVELRGLTAARTVVLAESVQAFDPLEHARELITEHAVNFAGRAATAMLRNNRCPICFTNEALRRDGKRLTVDDWVNLAADEALDADIAHKDQAGTSPVALTS